MAFVIDTNRDCTELASCLKASGVSTVIRYYRRGEPTAKVIRPGEALALSRAGLHVAIVHQRGGRDVGEYGGENGQLDGAAARSYGADAIGQPAGSGIYFAVDFDATPADCDRHIVPYFEGVKAAMESPDPECPTYRVGVYGSGLVCERLLGHGLATLTWLAQRPDLRGTPAFRASGRWNLAQRMPEPLCGIEVDRNDVNPAEPDFGQFTIA